MDMGLGKTFVGAEKLKQLNTPYNLLVCQKSKIKDWEEHFKVHYDYEVIIYKNQPTLAKVPGSTRILSKLANEIKKGSSKDTVK